MPSMIRHKIAVTAITAAALIISGAGIAYAVSVPNSGGQLTGTVYECVNTVNESHIYVELGHPAPGNCAAGYLQFTANQPAPASSPSMPAELVNSETFAANGANSTPECSATAPASFCVSLPAGAHLDGTPVVTDEDSSSARPVATTAVTDDNVTGKVSVTWGTNAPLAADTIQVTYDYAL